MVRFSPATLALLVLLPTTVLAQAAALPIRVEIEGVTGTVERNVRAVLGIARADTGRLTGDRAARLHRTAEEDIATALEPFGYYEPAVRGTLRQDGGRWIAHYRIDPGPPVVVSSLDVGVRGEGADTPPFNDLITNFELAKGDTLRHLPYETLKLDLLSLAADSGYLDAAFDTAVIRVDRAALSADIIVRFNTGPRFRFGEVTFHQEVLDENFLRTRVPFQRGQPYQLHKLLELQVSLSEDPYFSRVEVIPERGRAQGLEVPIAVELVARKNQAYEAGVGYATDNGPRGNASAALRRINRQGHHAELSITGSILEQSASVQYMIPAFGHPKGVLTLLAGYAILNPVTSDSRTWRLGARLARPRLGWRETFSITYQREAFLIGFDSATTTLLIPGASWERTRSDSRIFPSRGIRTRLDLQGAVKDVLSNASFVQVRASGKLIHSLGSRMRGIVRAEVGRNFTKTFRELPPTLRFFAGGDQSVRGFGYNALGPREAKAYIGGANLVVASLEADFRLMPRWAIAVFTDAGNATLDWSLDLEQSIGTGIRWISPIGLVRVDVALPVTEPDNPMRFHFSIGPDL